jgi:hypothetical protein
LILLMALSNDLYVFLNLLIPRIWWIGVHSRVFVLEDRSLVSRPSASGFVYCHGVATILRSLLKLCICIWIFVT